MMSASIRASVALTGGFTWFHNDIKNLIETDPVTFSTDVNIGRARTEGVEAYLAWQPLDTLKLRADYTYTEAEDADLHQELVRRPKNKFSVGCPLAGAGGAEPGRQPALCRKLDRWQPGVFRVSRLNAHPYFTADLAASYAMTDTLALTGRINNLLDKRYENPVGFQAPGVGFLCGDQGELLNDARVI